MQYPHSKEKSAGLSKSALDRIAAEDLPCTPDIFELWYVHYSGDNPELSHAIELLEITKKPIIDSVCQDLHQRYLSEERESDKVRRASDKIQTTIKNVNSVVSNVKIATEQYNSSLENANEKLTENATREELVMALQDVRNNTTRMLDYNRDLEQRLQESSQAMNDLRRDLELVRRQAYTDGLTGLANRKAFDSEITRVMDEAKAEGKTFSLALLDIDHFKDFNDSYGHQVGDQVLRLVARTLVDGVKGRDIAARYGGEEFAIILPNTNLPAAMRVTDVLREGVAAKEVMNRNTGDKLGRITLSGGVAQYNGGSETIEELIERADKALYKSKRSGRNQITEGLVPDRLEEPVS